jgi:hydroxymethylbilane synthase
MHSVWKNNLHSMMPNLIIGSRGSKLALAQANLVSAQLQELNAGLEIKIEIIKTTGDVKQDPLAAIGGKGVFTKELEEALLDRRIDIAVHSLKDLPTIIPEGLRLSAICVREDASDALLLSPGISERGTSIRDLPQNAVIGTSSPRRAAQLKHLRGDVVIKELRGNIDTRLRKLDEGQYDALILAAAGLRRLGLADRISKVIDHAEMVPAVGQGAIGLESRRDDEKAHEVCAKADDLKTRLACTAERAFLRALGGGCQLPIAGHAEIEGEQIRLVGLVADVAGSRLVKDQMTGPMHEAEEIGTELGRRLLNEGV